MAYWQTTGLQLECYPSVPEHVARPWDAADDYLAEQLDLDAPTLLINDRYGSLACAFHNHISWTDSACAAEARRQNLERNARPAGSVVHQLTAPLPEGIIQVVIKIPKNFEQLKDWLGQCQALLPDTTCYYLAGMAKHIPINWLQTLEANSSHYQQFRIVRKARLISLKQPAFDAQPELGYRHQQLQLQSLPGVFARKKLDIGSQVLLPHLSQIRSGLVCDLGCGNGLLGLSIKQQAPQTRVILTDDSYAAVLSARNNASSNQLEVEVRHGDALAAIDERPDWIVCNPPYHDGHKELTNTAVTMFRQSAQQLASGGKMMIVANRHLPYSAPLKRLFRSVNVLHQDSRFTIYLCAKPN